MNIQQAQQYITQTVNMYLDRDSSGKYTVPIARQRPVYLEGAPGLGKTAIVSQVAQQLGIGLVSYNITHHTRQSALGLPAIVQRSYAGADVTVTQYTLSEIISQVYDAIQQGYSEGILFIDEINCVAETLLPSMLDLLQNKRFGVHCIPEGWVLVTAGNPVGFNKSARKFDMATLDRVRRIVVEPDIDAFLQYGRHNNIVASILYHLSNNADHLFAMGEGRTEQFCTPRGWEDLSFAIHSCNKLGYEVTVDLIEQYIQSRDIAQRYYSSYINFGMQYNGIHCQDILAGRQGAVDYLAEDSGRYDFLSLLARQLLQGMTPAGNGKCIEDMLACAFEFVEGTFSAEDMEVFVLELLSNVKFVKYLDKHKSKVFQQYSKVARG